MLSRRSFLKRAGAAPLAVERSAAARRGAARPPISVAVVMEPTGPHLDAYLSSLADCAGIREIAIADRTGETFARAEQALGRKRPAPRTYRDPLEMVRRLRPELAVVSLESHHAPEVIEALLEAGCHVLSEKPACVRREQFERLTRIAEARNRHLMLALANRAHPPVVKARELVRSGALGKLYGAEVFLVADQTRLTKPENQRSWRAFKAKMGGGHLIWLGIHWLDLVQTITGDKVQQVCGFARNVGGQPIEVEDAAVLALRYRSGMVGTMHSGYYLDRGYQSGLTLWGKQGWLRFDLTAATPLEWRSTRMGSPPDVQSMPYTIDSREYLPFVQAAVDAARGAAPPPITAREGLHVLEVIFGLYRASETGTTQTIG
jgi:predicted dehydrogenase